jgi:hypothetical protein
VHLGGSDVESSWNDVGSLLRSALRSMELD